VVEDADAITEIDVMSNAVVLTIEVGGDKWTTSLPVSSHAEACRVSAAIAVRCGVLVEPLAESEDDKREREMLEGLGELPPRSGRVVVEPLAVQEELEADGLEDAADDDAMGAVMAGLVRKNTTPPRRWTLRELGL